MVVIVTPSGDQSPSFPERTEPVLVEALVPHPPVEALGVGVLGGLARLDEVDGDAALVSPNVEGLAGELGAVVTQDGSWSATLDHEGLQLTSDASAGQRQVDHRGQALASEVVHDVEGSEAAAIRQRIRDEVPTPALVRPRRCVRHDAWHRSVPTALPLTDGEVLQAVQAVDALVVDLEPLSAQQHGDTQVTEARPLSSDVLDALDERPVL